ncbi:MAG: glycosyltransferase family 4 protein [Candidatus Brocadiia bacterium]
MKILLLSSDHPGNPIFGGGGAHQINRICSILQEDNEIEVVTAGWPGGPVSSTVRGVKYTHGWRLPGRLLSRLGYCRLAAERAARGDFDLLVEEVSAFSPTSGPCLSRKPAIADFRLNPFTAADKYPAVAGLLRTRLRHNLKYYDGAIALCQGLASELTEWMPSLPDIQMVEPGIDKELLQQDVNEEKYILYLGRLDIEHKGLDNLLEAYGSMQEQFPGVHLVIAGDGPDEPRLRKMVAQSGLDDSVQWAGWVEGQEKRDLLRRCLLVCMPSRREGWGQVATEAAACAKPVVGYDVTGLRDAVVDGETGLLVEPEDTDALAGAMAKLIENPDLRHRLGRSARERARHFTWERAARKYEEVCRKVVEDN